MRLFRSLVLVLFALVCAAAVFLSFKAKPDRSGPTIVCSVKEIKEPCSVSEKKLLEYVSASDEKDGDISKKIFVENITPFITEGVSTVSFCVSDSDGNVAKRSVRLVYTDYEKPKFILNDDLVFAVGSVPDFNGAASVIDKFDGDITNRLYTILENGKDGSSSNAVLFKVTNSKGYTYEWRFKTAALPADEIGTLYKIKLKENVICLPVNSQKPDFKKLINGVYFGEKRFSKGRVVIDDSELTTDFDGSYNVWYRLYIGKGKGRKLLATERLIVVCGGDEG